MEIQDDQTSYLYRALIFQDNIYSLNNALEVMDSFTWIIFRMDYY